MTVMRKTYLARVIALLLLVELLGSCATPLTEQKQSNQLSSQADSKDFDIMLANAQLQNHAALRRFEDSLAKLEANYAQRFDSAANTVANKAAEKKIMLKTVVYLAKDSVRDTGETDKYLNQTIGPILNPLIDTYADEVQGLATKLDSELRNISMELAAKLSVTGSNNISVLRQGPPSVNSWAEFDKVLHDLGYTSSKFALLYAIRSNDLLMTKTNDLRIIKLPQLIKPIALSNFKPIIRRLIRSSLFPMIDGPLPIGDILAAISFIWNAYDLRQLQPRYQAEVLASTKGKLTSIRDSINVEAKTYANETTIALDKLQVEMRSQAAI